LLLGDAALELGPGRLDVGPGQRIVDLLATTAAVRALRFAVFAVLRLLVRRPS
jgi:hypothetical protein